MVTTAYITTDNGDWQAAPRVTGYEARYITIREFIGGRRDDGWYLAPTQTGPFVEIRRAIPVTFGACATNPAYLGNPAEAD